jgi:hypothetical protein
MLTSGVAEFIKGTTLHGAPRLAGEHRDSAEPANIIRMEYYL